MTDYIKREDAINKFATIVAGNSYERISDEVKHETAVKFFEDIPTADVRENITAHKVIGGGEHKGATCWFECSRCGKTVDVNDKYCSECGARFEA